MLRGYLGARPNNPTKGVLTLAEHREWVARGTVIGVQHKGTGSSNGWDFWDLRQVSLLGDVSYGAKVREISLTPEYFDAHPAYQFNDWTDAAGNVFCKIPIAYWWRGMLPDAEDGTTPRWTMLMSPYQISGFAASPGAFKRGGAWMDKFYFGKYRGHNAGSNKVGSKSGQTHWGSVSWENFRTYCANNGTGYHMISLQEWHEILGRAVVEKKTFQLVPEANRQNAALCKYRGIEEFAYHGSTYAEWMDGVRTDASGKYELWTEAGGDYSSTGVSCPSEAIHYNPGGVTGGLFDHLFLGASLRNSGVVGRICHSYFGAEHAYGGAFGSLFNYLPSRVSANIGSRLAKW